jgi:hypothetical protein
MLPANTYNTWLDNPALTLFDYSQVLEVGSVQMEGKTRVAYFCTAVSSQHFLE